MVETSYTISNAPRLALLADIHGRPYQRVTASLRANRPEIICICGDIVYGNWPENGVSLLKTQINVMPFLRECVGIAPTYLSLGNHEQKLDGEDIKEIENAGVVVLDNSWIEIPEKGILVGGLTSGYVTEYRRIVEAYRAVCSDSSRYPGKEKIQEVIGFDKNPDRKPDTAWLADFAAAQGFHILLSHHPEYYALIPDQIELILSGHAHGGQWRVGKQGVFSPGEGFFPKYTKGVYHGRLVVSAGLANTAKVPRLFNPTEIVYI